MSQLGKRPKWAETRFQPGNTPTKEFPGERFIETISEAHEGAMQCETARSVSYFSLSSLPFLSPLSLSFSLFFCLILLCIHYLEAEVHR